MTRSVDRSKATNYMKKADGALRMAKMAVREGEFDAAVMNSIHGAINAMHAEGWKAIERRQAVPVQKHALHLGDEFPI